MYLITPEEILAKLTETNLVWHLSHYNSPDPLNNNAPFFENTPFISTTAGSVERDEFAKTNVVFDPFLTALRFATRNGTSKGYIFYAYLFTLGRQSIELCEFAEEVRELNIYTTFLPYHHQGEVTAKIEIRAPQIEKWEEYDPSALRTLQNRAVPVPSMTRRNPLYAPPERFCNIRGLVTA